jgi:tRNA G10  N-methylase Trm11
MDCVNSNFRNVSIFDAIICDPPYGVRAMTRTKGKKKKTNEKN